MLSARVVSVMALVVSVLMAAAPIATVVSGEGLKVRGTPVPPTSVSSFPVASGDELASGASPAVVMFKDQSRLTLSANSRAKLEQRDGNTCIFLLDGSINLNAVAGAKMTVCAPGRSLVAQTPFEGQITLDANTFKVNPVQGTLTEGKSVCSESPIFAAMGGKTTAIVIMTAAAAGGTAAALVLTRSEEPARSGSR